MHVMSQRNAGVKRSIRPRHNGGVNYILIGSRLLLAFINHGLRAVIIIDRQNYSRATPHHLNESILGNDMEVD